MADAVKVFLLVLSALFPIVDPLSGSPLFLALAEHYSPAIRKKLSRRVAINSLFLMIGSYFIGAHVLDFLVFRCPWCRLAGDWWSSRWGGGYL